MTTPLPQPDHALALQIVLLVVLVAVLAYACWRFATRNRCRLSPSGKHEPDSGVVVDIGRQKRFCCLHCDKFMFML